MNADTDNASASRQSRAGQSGLSLRKRALFILIPFYFLFFVVLAYLLQNSFAQSMTASLQRQLQLQLQLLLADSEPDGEAGIAVAAVQEPQFNIPDGSLQAFVVNDQRELLWRSQSMASAAAPQAILQQPVFNQQLLGQRLFTRLDSGQFVAVYSIAFEIDRADRAELSPTYSYFVIDDGSAYDQQLAVFRQQLVLGLLLALLVFSLLHLLILRWLFRPLVGLGEELRQIERGERQAFQKSYPSEIEPLTRQLNEFVEVERQQRERYKNTLSDLAHSLKTPLAVMRSEFDGEGATQKPEQMLEQIERMEQIVRHQLRRSSVNAATSLGNRTCARQIIERLTASLDKVYRDKRVKLAMEIPVSLELPLPEDDSFELLGNLLDNAYKYCDQSVRINGGLLERADGYCAEIVIENDGQLISRERAAAMLERGVRLDESTEGQGIGLSVSLAILESYDGALEIGDSALGGAQLRLLIPLKQ